MEIVLRLIRGKKIDRSSPAFKNCLDWLGYWPSEIPEVKKRELINTVCETFEVSEAELIALLAGATIPASVAAVVDEDSDMRSILPRGGWFEWYDQYTRKTEAPLSFHIFSSLSVLGASMGRRCYIDMGFFRIYPNYCSILIGPTGRVKKTSAVDIAKELVKEGSLCPIMADKITPEALARTLKDSGHHFIYAPELSVFLSKKQYNEGLVTLIIRLLDSPDSFEIDTIVRGKEVVENVAITMLGGSTLSLLSTSSPTEVMSSGFLNRFVLVVEEDTSRCFAIPERGSEDLHQRLLQTIVRLKSFVGTFRLNEQARAGYESWYADRRKLLRNAPSEMVAEVLERSPSHLLRTAMLVHAAQCDNMSICIDCLRIASNILSYAEKRIPQTVSVMSQNISSQDAEFLYETLKRLGGASDHSKLLRRVSYRMGVAIFRKHMSTLIESKRVREEKRGALQFYIITETGDAAN